MNNIKQIRKQFDLITEKEEKEDRKLSALVRAGLYDAKKLPALKKALEKSADKITSQEKRMLVNLLDSLISQVVSDDQVYRKVRQNVHSMNEAKMDTYSKFDPRYKAGWPTDKEMPSVLILKRKAIRVYPDNQKVALYYSQALDKYVTIPYNDIQMGLDEAKKNDKDDKIKRRVAGLKISGKRVEMRRKAIDTAHLLGKTGEYKNAFTRLKGIQSRGNGKHDLAIGLGTLIHDKIRGAVVRNKLKNRTKKVPAANKPVSAPAPATQEQTKSKTTVAPPKQREGKALKNRMNQIVNKNGPGHEFSQATLKKAATNETFQRNLQMIRESKQQVDEVFPLIGAAVAGAARLAAPYVIRGAAGLARSGLGALKGAGKTGKGLSKGSRLARLAVKARRLARGAGAAAGALGVDGGKSNSSSDPSTKPTYNFTKKPELSIPTKADTNATRNARRQTYSDKANSELAKSQANESNVLDTIKLIVENNISEQTVRFNENEISINNTVAKKLLNVYESVNKTNKKKMEQMLNENATSFNKVLTFAVRQ
jgi:hypothetical protein